jgi:hypothetical protein
MCHGEGPIHCLIESLQVYGVDDEITGSELHGIDGALDVVWTVGMMTSDQGNV